MKQDATFDTSFWVNAYRAGLLPYVLARFALRYVPEVAAETTEANPRGREFWRLVRAGELVMAEPAELRTHDYGLGERAAISLVVEQTGWMLLIDDYRPLQAAIDMGLQTMCTPFLVAALLEDGTINGSKALSLLARLDALQTVSPRLIESAPARINLWLESGG